MLKKEVPFSIEDRKIKGKERYKVVNVMPGNEPFLSYLDSNNQLQINEAINYFHNNISVVNEDIFDKLTCLLMNVNCNGQLLETIGDALKSHQNLNEFFNYNACYSNIYSMFAEINSEYPFFNRPELAGPALHFFSKYASLSDDNRIILIELGVFDAIMTLLNIFVEQPEEEKDRHFHKTILQNTFRLIDSMFYNPDIIPDKNIIVNVITQANVCLANIKTEEDIESFQLLFAKIILTLFRGTTDTKIINQIYMCISDFLYSSLENGSPELQIIICSILVGITGNDDSFSQLIIDDGFLTLLIPLFESDNEILIAKILMVLCNISACGDVCEFKKVLDNEAIVSFLLSCSRNHKVQVIAISLRVLWNIIDSDIISITDFALENDEFVESLVSLLQMNEVKVIDYVCWIIDKIIADITVDERKHDEFIDHLIQDYDINEAIDDIINGTCDNLKELKSLKILNFEVDSYINKTKERDDIVCDYSNEQNNM